MKPLLLLVISSLLAVNSTGIALSQSNKSSTSVEREVRDVFDRWSTALTRGDKKTYVETFWNSPRLVIRVAGGEWRGIVIDPV